MYYKITTAILVFTCCSLAVCAQFKKGERMISADIGSAFFNSGSSDVSFPPPTQGYSAKSTGFGLSVMPSMGWFISNNIAVGFSLDINPTGNKNSYTSNGTTFQQDKTNSFNLGAGGFVRDYFRTGSSLVPFGQLSVDFGMSSQKTSGFFYGGSGPTAYKDTYDGKSSGGFFANSMLSFGMTKLLNPHTGLDFFAGYNFSYSRNTFKKTTNEDDGNNGSIDITSVSQPSTKFTNNGFSIGVGFQIFLDSKK